MNYIKAQEIIDSVKNILRTHFNSNTLDTSFMYEQILLCLSDLGLKINPYKEDIVEIKNYKGKLPKDLYRLDYAYYCGTKTLVTKPAYEGFVITEKFNEQIPVTTPSVEVCTDEQGCTYQLFKNIQSQIFKYSDFYPLKVSDSSIEYCTADCKNMISDNTVHITGVSGAQQITAEFCEGDIVIGYTALMEEDDEIIIPDNPKIKEFIKTHLIWKSFEMIMYNNDMQVQPQLKYAFDQASINREKAIRLARTPEVHEMYRFLNKRRKYYNRFANSTKHLHYGDRNTINKIW